MATTIAHLQSTFTLGEISPLMLARADYEGYYKGALKLRNLQVIPQGGAKKRFGLVFDMEILNLNSADEFAMSIINYSLTERYLVTFTKVTIKVYKLVATRNAKGISYEVIFVNEIVSQYNADEIKDLRFTQSTSVLLIDQENHPTRLVRRIVALSGWDAATNVPVLVSGVGAEGDAYNVTVAGTTTLDGISNWVVGDWLYFTGGVWTKMIAAIGENPWQLVDKEYKHFPIHDFDGGYYSTDFTPSALGGNNVDIVASGGSFVFSIAFIGGGFEGNGGTLRFTQYISPTTMRGNVITPFNGDSAIAPVAIAINGKDAIITQPAFSAANGYPKNPTFYQDRLWFGGTKKLTSHIFGSFINDFFNFDTLQGTDDDGLDVLAQSTGLSYVLHVIGAQSLVVLTSDSVHATAVLFESAVTPGNISLNKQNGIGAEDVQPQVVDNQIIYVQKGGKIVRALEYDGNSGKYNARDISSLSPQLIKNPVSSARFQSHTSDDTQYLLLVNEDGTIANFQFLPTQSVEAWSGLSTDGKFLKATGDEDALFFLIDRNGKYYLEHADYNVYTDSTVVYTAPSPVTTVTGLDHLNGYEVQIVADGYILDPQTVINGEITTILPYTEFKIGLPFSVLLETMPVNINTPAGPDLYLAKRIFEVYIDYYETLGIKVEGIPVPDLEFDSTSFSGIPEPKTGVFKLNVSKGYEPRQQTISITQDLPLPVTILGVSYEVKI